METRNDRTLINPEKIKLQIDEESLPAVIKHELDKIRSQWRLFFCDQRRNVLEPYRSYPACNLRYKDERLLFIFANPDSPTMMDNLIHEIGHLVNYAEGLEVDVFSNDLRIVAFLTTMLFDPLVEVKLEALGIDRSTHRQETFDSLKSALSGIPPHPPQRYSVLLRCELCMRYVKAKLELGEERFAPLEALWNERVVCDLTKRTAREVYAHLNHNRPRTQAESIAALRFVSSLLGVSGQVTIDE